MSKQSKSDVDPFFNAAIKFIPEMIFYTSFEGFHNIFSCILESHGSGNQSKYSGKQLWKLKKPVVQLALHNYVFIGRG